MPPRLLSRISTSIGSAVDGALVGAARLRFRRHTPHAGDRARLLDEATGFYRQPEILSGERFFLDPPALVPDERRVRRLGTSGEVVDVSWRSAFTPRWERMARDYLSHEPNLVAHARMYRHATPRPAIICLHGYAGGRFFIEERAFVANWLYRIGLDVAMFVLPFHGPRAVPKHATTPIWPSPHVARLNEGFAHAMFDLRALVRWLRARGAPHVAVTGMSLGGFTTSLLATVEPLDFAAPMIPVASWGDLFWQHGAASPERAAAEREGITLERMKAAMEVVTPLARKPLLPGERVLVVAAKGDRIAPPAHAAWLADHFRARRLTFDGGHVLQFGRGDAFRAIAQRLSELGILPERGR